MQRLNQEVIQFFLRQGFVIVSTRDRDGKLHNSCKGIVRMDKEGRVWLLDLYRARTYTNLKSDRHISITAVDEHTFKGYCLKGKADISPNDMDVQFMKDWEERITSRLTQRLLRNIREEKTTRRHPEALLPKPEYVIVMEVAEIVDLTPGHLKRK